jgi:glycosyltransferase involved in cell wall biosynthesis
MTGRLPISVCIISGADAGRIARCLASVSDWVSEIIVVLNEEVTDDTQKIAESHGAKVFREPWKGHIAQKNSAFEKASQPWIFGLDTDEEVSPSLKNEILTLFSQKGGLEASAAFSFPRLSWYMGRWIRHGDWYPDRKVRLCRKGAAHWGGIDPHDKLMVEGPVRRLSGDLLHYSNQSIDQQIAKIPPYASDFVKHYLDQGGKPGFFDLAVRPGWRFLRAYFIRLGFLDGWPGFYLAWIIAFTSLTRYFKAREELLKKGGA